MEFDKRRHLEDLYLHLSKNESKFYQHIGESIDVTEKWKAHLRDRTLKKTPIIIGPWLSEIGYELLYWIPWLKKHIGKHTKIKPSDCIVISRGGCKEWYKGIADHYVDLLSYFSLDEYHEKSEKRIQEQGKRKHYDVSSFDQEILKRVADEYGITHFRSAHPSILYQSMHAYWYGLIGYKWATYNLQFTPFEKPPLNVIHKLGLEPGEYYTIKFYYSGHFSKSDKTRKLIDSLLSALTKKQKLVILSVPYELDDHRNVDIPHSDRILNLNDYLTPENNLAIQSEVVAHCKRFHGTYGGFSYLACMYGVDSINYYENADNIVTAHMETAFQNFNRQPFGKFMPIDLDTQDLNNF